MIDELFPDNTPTVHEWKLDLPKYNRHERRTGTFVLRNKYNGLFIKRTVEGEKITYQDVELDKASRYTFDGVKYLVGEALGQNIDIEYRMVYLGTNKQINFK
jgi:hypothetical protein